VTLELLFNLVLAAGIGGYLVLSIQLPGTDNPSDVLGAGGFPIAIGVLGLIVIAAITVRVARTKTPVHVPLFEPGSVDGRSLMVNVALLLGYVALLEVLGFAISTFAYLLAAGWTIGYRKPGMLFLFALLVAGLLTVVFGTVFAVPLPRGVGPIRELSYLVY
jgi:hypothetical protein